MFDSLNLFFLARPSAKNAPQPNAILANFDKATLAPNKIEQKDEKVKKKQEGQSPQGHILR